MDTYLMQDGSTIPVKFQLVEVDGSVVTTAPVTVMVTRDSDGAEVFSASAVYDPQIPGYYVNVQTKGWEVGDYSPKGDGAARC